MRIQIDVDSTSVQRSLAALNRSVSDLRPLFAGIGADIVADAQLRFRDSKDPYGAPWKPLSPKTIARRRNGSSKPLLDTGRLRNSVSYRLLGNSAVEIGSSVAYAAIHQFGGTIRYAPRSIAVRLRKRSDGRTVFAKDKHKRARTVWGTNASGWSVNIPARPFLATQARGLPREYGEIINARLAAHFRGVAG